MANSDIDIIRDDVRSLRADYTALLTTVTSIKEQVEHGKYTNAQHTTELGNLRQVTGKYSSLIDFMNEQIQDLIHQKQILIEMSNSAKDAAVKLQSYEALCEEKFKNISIIIDQVREKGESSDKHISETITSLSSKVADINEQLKVFKKHIWSISVSIIIWALSQIAQMKGLL